MQTLSRKGASGEGEPGTQVGQAEAKLGRPSKFTPEVVSDLERNIAAGLPYELACGLSGIAYSTYRNWMVAAAQEGAEPELVEFLERIRRAETEAEARFAAQWISKTADDWRASRDYLARRWPERWASRDRIEMTGPHGGAIPVTFFIPDNKRDPPKTLKE